MARINVEQKALTDPRFRVVGNRLSPLNKATISDVEQAFGLWLAIRVWEFAQERGTDLLPGVFIEAIYPGLTDAMIDAELLEVVDDRTLRVRGWEDADGGWLERSRRSSSRAGGKARSSSAKRGPDGTFLPASSSEPPASLDQPKPARSSAPAPAPAPALSGSVVSPEASNRPKAECVALYPSAPPALTFPTNGSGPPTWDLTQPQVDAWAKLYPGVDVLGESRKALAWIHANHRKTASGMPRFLVSWLNKANDHQRAPTSSKRETAIENNRRLLDQITEQDRKRRQMPGEPS